MALFLTRLRIGCGEGQDTGGKSDRATRKCFNYGVILQPCDAGRADFLSEFSKSFHSLTVI